MYEFEYVFESINVAKSVLDECVCVFQRTLLSLSLSGETPCIPCLQRVVAISLSCDSVIRLYLLKKSHLSTRSRRKLRKYPSWSARWAIRCNGTGDCH